MEKVKQIIKEYEEIQFEGLQRGYDEELYSLIMEDYHTILSLPCS